ncbi:hypothetical protein IWQ61_000831 [Dispira simplex]|nr:hypothetical protein IWQ61_000831 [Dispira simplex]
MPYALKLTFRGVCRKFVFADRSTLNWDNLDRNVRSLFNIDFPFFLQYEDEEGEVITCSSTFELREILPLLDDTGARTFQLSIVPLNVPSRAVYSRIHHYANDYSDGPSSFSSFDSSIDRLQRQQNLDAGIGIEGGASGLPEDNGVPMVTQPHLGGHKRRYRHASTAPPPPVDMATTGTDPRSFAEITGPPPPLPPPPPTEAIVQIASGEFPPRWPRAGTRVLPSGVDPQRVPTIPIPISSVSVPALPTYWTRPPSLPASFLDPSIQLEGEAAPSSHSRKPSFMEGASSVENLVSGRSIASKFHTSSVALESILADVPEHHEMAMSWAEIATQRSSVMSQKHAPVSSRPPSGASVQRSQLQTYSGTNSHRASLQDAPSEPDFVPSNPPLAVTSRQSIQRSKHPSEASIQQASLHTVWPTSVVPSDMGSANTSKLHQSGAMASQLAPPELSGSQRQTSITASSAAISATSAVAAESEQAGDAASQEPQASVASSKKPSKPVSEIIPEVVQSIHDSAAPSVLRTSQHSVIGSPSQASVHPSVVKSPSASRHSISKQKSSMHLSRQEPAANTSVVPPSHQSIAQPSQSLVAAEPEQSGDAASQEPQASMASSKKQSKLGSVAPAPEVIQSVHGSAAPSVLRASRHSVIGSPSQASIHPSMVKSPSASRHSIAKQQSSMHTSRQEPAANTSVVPSSHQSMVQSSQSAGAAEPEQAGDAASQEPQPSVASSKKPSKPGSVAPAPEVVLSVHGSAAPSVLRVSQHSAVASPPRASVHVSRTSLSKVGGHDGKVSRVGGASQIQQASRVSVSPEGLTEVSPTTPIPDLLPPSAVTSPRPLLQASLKPQSEVVSVDQPDAKIPSTAESLHASNVSVHASPVPGPASVHPSVVKSPSASSHSIAKQQSSMYTFRQELAANTSVVPPSHQSITQSSQSSVAAEPEQSGDAASQELQASMASTKKQSKPGSVAPAPEVVLSVHGSAAPSVLRVSQHSAVASPPRASVHVSRTSLSKVGGHDGKVSRVGGASQIQQASRVSVSAEGLTEVSPTTPIPDLLPPSAVTSPRPLPQASLEPQSEVVSVDQPDAKIPSTAESLHASNVSVHASPVPGPASVHPSVVKSPSASSHSIAKQQTSMYTFRQELAANTSVVPPSHQSITQSSQSSVAAEPEQSGDAASQELQASMASTKKQSKPGSVAPAPEVVLSVHGSAAPSVLRVSQHSAVASPPRASVHVSRTSLSKVGGQDGKVSQVGGASQIQQASRVSVSAEGQTEVSPTTPIPDLLPPSAVTSPRPLPQASLEPQSEVVSVDQPDAKIPSIAESLHASKVSVHASPVPGPASVHHSVVKSPSASRHSISKQRSNVPSRQSSGTSSPSVITQGSQGSLKKSKLSSPVSSFKSGSRSSSSGASSRLMASLLNIDEPAGPIHNGEDISLNKKSGRSSHRVSPTSGSPQATSKVRVSPSVRSSLGSKVVSERPSRVSVVAPVEPRPLEKSPISTRLTKSKVSVVATPVEHSHAASVHSPLEFSKKASQPISKYASPQLRQSYQFLMAGAETSTVAASPNPEPEPTAQDPEQAVNQSVPASRLTMNPTSPMAKSSIAAPVTPGVVQMGENFSRASLHASRVSVALEKDPSAVPSRRSKMGSLAASAIHRDTVASRTDLPGATSRKSSGHVASPAPAQNGHYIVLTPPGVYPTAAAAEASASRVSSRKISKVASPATQRASMAITEKTPTGGAFACSNLSISALDLTQNRVGKSASVEQNVESKHSPAPNVHASGSVVKPSSHESPALSSKGVSLKGSAASGSPVMIEGTRPNSLESVPKSLRPSGPSTHRSNAYLAKDSQSPTDGEISANRASYAGPVLPSIHVSHASQKGTPSVHESLVIAVLENEGSGKGTTKHSTVSTSSKPLSPQPAVGPSDPTSRASKPTSPVVKPSRSQESMAKISSSSSRKSSKHPTPTVQVSAAVPTPMEASVHASVAKTASVHHSLPHQSQVESMASIHTVLSKSTSKASSAASSPGLAAQPSKGKSKASPQSNSPLAQGSIKQSVVTSHQSIQKAQVPEQPQDATASEKSATPPSVVKSGQASPIKAILDCSSPVEPAATAQPENVDTSLSRSSLVQSHHSSSALETRMKASPLPVVMPGVQSPPSKAQSNAKDQTSQVRPQVSIDKLVSPVSSAIEKIRSIANSSKVSIGRAKLAEKKSTTSHATSPTSSHASVPIPQALTKTPTPPAQGASHRASLERSSRISPANQGSPVVSPTQSSMLSHQAASHLSNSRITSSHVQRTPQASHSSVAELVEHFSRESSHGSVKATSRPMSERESTKSSKPVTPTTGSHSKAGSGVAGSTKSSHSPPKGSGPIIEKAVSQKSVKSSAAPSKVPSPGLDPSQDKIAISVSVSASASQRLSRAPSEVAEEPAKDDTVSFLDATFTTSVAEERNERIDDLRGMLITLAESLSNLYPDYGPPATNILPSIPKQPADGSQHSGQFDGNTASKQNLEKSALLSMGGSPVLKTQPPTAHHSSPPSRSSRFETQEIAASKSKLSSVGMAAPAPPSPQHGAVAPTSKVDLSANSVPVMSKSQSSRRSSQTGRTPTAVVEAQAASVRASVAASATTPTPVASKSGRGSARASLTGNTSALPADNNALLAKSRVPTRPTSPPHIGHQSPAQAGSATTKAGPTASIPEVVPSSQPAGDVPQITVERDLVMVEPVIKAPDPTLESATGKISFIGVPSLKVVTPGGSVHESKIDSPHSLAVSSQASHGSPSSSKQDPGIIPQGDESQSVVQDEENVLSQAVAKAEAALASVEALNSVIRQAHPTVSMVEFGGEVLDASLLAAAQIPLPISQATSRRTSVCTSPLAKPFDSLSHSQEALPTQVEPTGDTKSPFLTASFAAGFPLPPSGAGSFFSAEGTYTTHRTPGGSPVLTSFKHRSHASGQPSAEVVTTPADADAAGLVSSHSRSPSITASQAAQYRLPSSVSGRASRHSVSQVEPQPTVTEPTMILPIPERTSGTASPRVAAKPPSASDQDVSPAVVASQHSVMASSPSAVPSKAGSIRTRVSNSLFSLLRVATNVPLPSSVSGSEVGSGTSPHSPAKSSLKCSSVKTPGISVPLGNTIPLIKPQSAEQPADNRVSHSGKSSKAAVGVSLPGSPPAVFIEGYREGDFPLNGPLWVPIDDPLAIPLAIDEMLDQLHEVTDMLKNLMEEHPNLVEPIMDVIRKVQNTVLNSIDHVARSSVASMSRSPSHFVDSSRMPTVPISKVPSALGRPPVMGSPKRRVSAVASPLAANLPLAEPSISETSDRKSKVTAVRVASADVAVALKSVSSRSGSGTPSSRSVRGTSAVPPVGSDQPVDDSGSTSSPEQIDQFPSTKVEPGSMSTRTKSQTSNCSRYTKASAISSASRSPKEENGSAKSESLASKVSLTKSTVAKPASPVSGLSVTQPTNVSPPDVPVLDVRRSNKYNISGSQVVEGKIDTKYPSRVSGATSPRTPAAPATKHGNSVGPSEPSDPKSPSSPSGSVGSSSRSSHSNRGTSGKKFDVGSSGEPRKSAVPPPSERANSKDTSPSVEGTNKSVPSPVSPGHSENIIPVRIVEEVASPTPPKVRTRSPSLDSQLHTDSMPSLSNNSGSTSPSEASSSVQTPSPSLHEASFVSSVDHHIQIPISQRASFIEEIPVMNTPDDGVPPYLQQHSFNHCSLSHTSFSASFHVYPSFTGAPPGGVSGGTTPLKPKSGDFSSGFPKSPCAFPFGAVSPSGGMSPSRPPEMSEHTSSSFTGFPNLSQSVSFEVNPADQPSFHHDDRQGGRNWFPSYTSYLPPTEHSNSARVSTIKVPVKHCYSHRSGDSANKLTTDAISEEYDTITRRLMARGFPNYHLVYSIVQQCGGDITVAELRLTHAQSF